MASYFCDLPLNTTLPTDSSDGALTGTPLNMLDDNPNTYWELNAATGSVKFPLGISNVEFDAYYLITSNLGDYTLTGLTAQNAPKDIIGATATSDSIQYAFHALDTPQTATSATLSWTSRVDNGAPVRIYKAYVLNRLIDVSPSEGYSQINQSFNLRGARVQESLDGQRTRTRPLSITGKWTVAYQMNMLNQIEQKIDRLNSMFFDHPNFTHIVNWPAHRDRVYRAYISVDTISHQYISSTFTGAGSFATFTIEQQ